MVASALHFFKVPMDNTYSNVYDFPDFDNVIDSDIIFANLSSLFDSTTVSVGLSDKSFKTTNGKTTLSIPVLYDAIKNYNYLAVERNVGHKEYEFYFVTGMSSLNNGVLPSTNISIDYDCWMNNIASLSENILTQIYSQGHVKDVIKTANKYYPNSLLGDSADVNLIESANQDIPGEKVLWARIWLDGANVYTKSGDAYNLVNVPGCYLNNLTAPVVFVPYAVVDTYKMTKLRGYTFGGSVSLDTPLSFGQIDNILKVDLTYYPPFTYSISGGKDITIYTSGLSTIAQSDLYVKRDDSYVSIVNRIGKIVSSSNVYTQIPTICAYGFTPTISGTDGAYDERRVLAQTITLSLPELSDYTADSFITDYLTLPTAKIYPYQYNAICANGTISPIIYYPGAITCTIKIYSENVSPYYIIEYLDKDGVALYTSKPIFVSNSGTLLTHASAYDVYLRNNGNTLALQYETLNTDAMMNAVSKATMLSGAKSGIARRTIVGAAAGVYDWYIGKARLDARVEDIRNGQGKFNMPSYDANTNIMQDIILIRKFTPSDNYMVELAALTEQRYGKVLDFSGQLLDRNMKIFDFKRIDSPELPTITNNQERATLTAALQRGVCVWHMSASASTNVKAALKSFNYNIHNPYVGG